ncbi:MAG: hypothetical protein WBW14_08830, partial [Candidatus Acidiferrum sp.]
MGNRERTNGKRAEGDTKHSCSAAATTAVVPGRRVGRAASGDPKEIAASFASLLGHPVRVEVVARETWESLFKSQGMKNPAPRIQMLDGFNEGWIDFEGKGVGSRKGKVA